MKWLEMRLTLSRKHTGLVLSPKHRLSQSDSFKNLALVAPTGSGKTTRFVIPNLLSLNGSAVVTDPSGEIFRATSGHLSKRGFNIQVLQPALPEKSLHFNPLPYFDSPQERRRLAATLAQSSSGKDPFWTIGATNILTIALTALSQVEDPQYKNLANLRWILNHFGVSGEGIQDFMVNHLDDITFADYKAFVAQDTKVIASILSSARAALDLWSDPDVATLTTKNTMDIASIRDKPTVIYLIVPEHKIHYFSITLNLFYSACFEHCLSDWQEGNSEANTHKLPVYFFLDEFGNLGRINGFASMITTLRKRRCSISIILQELSQLEAIYDRNDARSIFAGGCSSKLFFSGLDVETCSYVERALGQNTEYDTLFKGISEYARTVAVPLKRTDEIRMLDAEKGIFITGRQPPALLNIPPFYTVPQSQAQTGIPAAPLPQNKASSATFNYLPLEKS